MRAMIACYYSSCVVLIRCRCYIIAGITSHNHVYVVYINNIIIWSLVRHTVPNLSLSPGCSPKRKYRPDKIINKDVSDCANEKIIRVSVGCCRRLVAITSRARENWLIYCKACMRTLLLLLLYSRCLRNASLRRPYTINNNNFIFLQHTYGYILTPVIPTDRDVNEVGWIVRVIHGYNLMSYYRAVYEFCEMTF